MKKYDFKHGVLFDAVKSIRSGRTEYLESPAMHAEKLIQRTFERDQEFKRYCDRFAEKEGLRPYCILDAHGDQIQNKWTFTDGNRREPVQSWVDENDGQFGTLVLHVCNPQHALPHSRKSLILVSDGDVMVRDDSAVESHKWSILHPKHGEITNYTIESALRELR